MTFVFEGSATDLQPTHFFVCCIISVGPHRQLVPNKVGTIISVDSTVYIHMQGHVL